MISTLQLKESIVSTRVSLEIPVDGCKLLLTSVFNENQWVQSEFSPNRWMQLHTLTHPNDAPEVDRKNWC